MADPKGTHLYVNMSASQTRRHPDQRVKLELEDAWRQVMAKQEQTTVTSEFPVGAKVRVRPGVMDTDYPDLPIGGWAGTVIEVHDGGMFTIQWSEETLALIHPVFKKRCEKDGLEFDVYWIRADDLETDRTAPLKIDQPEEIRTKPLSPKDQDDRIRMVFGLTSNDPLPDVEIQTLATYQGQLWKNLAFPFSAEHGEEYGHPERIKVIGLGDPDDDTMIDETCGILCDAKLDGRIVTLPLSELAEPSRNRPLLDDYCYWFWNWR